jgi:hypothetical protein
MKAEGKELARPVFHIRDTRKSLRQKNRLFNNLQTSQHGWLLPGAAGYLA